MSVPVPPGWGQDCDEEHLFEFLHEYRYLGENCLIYAATGEAYKPKCCGVDDGRRCRVKMNGFNHVWQYTVDGACRMAVQRYCCAEHGRNFDMFSEEAMQMVDWDRVWMCQPVFKFGGWAQQASVAGKIQSRQD